MSYIGRMHKMWRSRYLKDKVQIYLRDLNMNGYTYTEDKTILIIAITNVTNK